MNRSLFSKDPTNDWKGVWDVNFIYQWIITFPIKHTLNLILISHACKPTHIDLHVFANTILCVCVCLCFQEASESDARTTPADYFRRKGLAARLQAPAWCPSSIPYLSGWAQPPYGGNSFQPLVFATLFFRSLPKVCDHRWGLERRPTSKLRALPFGSALSSPRRSGTAPVLLLQPHRSACRSPAPSYPHSWIKPWDT